MINRFPMGRNTYLGISKYLAKFRDVRDRDDVTIGELVDSKFRNISETHKAYLPEKENIKKMADKERRRANPTPGHPKTIDDIDMPDDCRKILKNAQDDKGRLFLQHECSKNGKQKFLSLARMRMWRSYAAVTLCSQTEV